MNLCSRSNSSRSRFSRAAERAPILLLLLAAVVLPGCDAAPVADSVPTFMPGLYDGSPYVAYLDQKTAVHALYGSPSAWLVEFYAHWCGHCQNYVPKWNAAARDLYAWQPVMRVAAINCGDPLNSGVCKQHGIRGYPTVKFVPSNAQMGQAVRFNSTDANGLRKQALAEMRKLGHTFMGGIPQTWPAVRDVLGSPRGAASVAVYRGPGDDGIESVLDLWHFRQTINVVSVHVSSVNVTETRVPELPPSGIVPAVYFANPADGVDHTVCIESATLSCARQIEDAVAARFALSRVYRTEEKPAAIVRRSTRLRYVDHPHADDVWKAVEHMMQYEVSTASEISGPALTAFLGFIHALRVYLPADEAARAALARLDDWVQLQSAGGSTAIKQEDWSAFMKTWHMPGYETRQWNYCRGSSPQYRGYTCGLWTVFHCLSVGATQHSFTASIDTLLAIRGYVEHFFGCKNCARHFLLVAATTTDSSLADHGAAGPMLWLWQTHNAANARIGSDPQDRSTDPDFPKETFPPASRCRSCFLANGSWHLPAVAEFLNNYYSIVDGIDADAQGELQRQKRDASEVAAVITGSNSAEAARWSAVMAADVERARREGSGGFLQSMTFVGCIILSVFVIIMALRSLLQWRQRRLRLRKQW